MSRPLSPGAPLPPPLTNDPALLNKYLVRQSQNLRETLTTMAERVNDELLVRPDWIRALDQDYLALQSDRVLLFFPTVDRTVTLPLTADMEEPHPITVRHAGGGSTVSILPSGSETLDGGPSLLLSPGEARTLVALRQTVVDRDGIGTVGWYSTARL